MARIESTLLTLFIAGGVASFANAQVPQKPGRCAPPSSHTFRSISKEEVTTLLADVAESNAKALDRLREDPELKRVQLNNLRELLASAFQATKEGLSNDNTNCAELANIHDEVIAVAYDKEANKQRTKMPPFGYISSQQVDSFWSSDGEARKAAFDRFIAAKLEILKRSDPAKADREISADEMEQARDFYARTQISKNEFLAKTAALPKAFRDKVYLQVKLQQAQVLARLYADKAADAVAVTPDEVGSYIARHPEFSSESKRVKADQILVRAKKGEDFAALANEFSDDPGNVGDSGKKAGGLYSGVHVGQMVEPFEKAALSVGPGNVYPELVRTVFGYHIIKLEGKGAGNATYDVRHILVSTMYKDPDNPSAREVPVEQYVREKLEASKQQEVIDRIVAANGISVPNDFDVPPAKPTVAPKKPAGTAKRKRTPVRRK